MTSSLDPPYQMHYEPLLERILSAGLLAHDGWILMERGCDKRVFAPMRLKFSVPKTIG